MTWREAIKVHPAADLLPNVGKQDLKKIGQDILDHGLKSPIVLWCGPNNKSYLLDGRTRLDALEAVGVKVMAGKKLHASLGLDLEGGAGPTIRRTYSPESTMGQNKIVEIVNPYDFVMSANIRRRHLSKEKQADIIVEIIEAEAATRLSQNGKTGEPAPKPRNAKGQVKGSKKGTRAKAVAAGKEAGVGRATIDRSITKAKAAKGEKPKARKNAKKSDADKAAHKLVVAAETLSQTVVDDLSDVGIAYVRRVGDLVGKVMDQIKTRHASVEDL